MAGEKVYVIVTEGKRVKWVSHYGIYVTDGAGRDVVYHCPIDGKNAEGGCATKEDYKDFIANRKPLNYYKTDLTEKDVINKITEIDKKTWLPLIFTCGDFTRRITKISPFFTQKKMLVSGIGIAVALILFNKIKP